jgi:hypothetical protein
VECTRPIDGDQQKGSALRAWFCVPEGILPSTFLCMARCGQKINRFQTVENQQFLKIQFLIHVQS